MSFFDWLRSTRAESASTHGDTDTVRRIVAELDTLPQTRARFLAAFAYVLSRVAGADRHVSEEETATMAAVIQEVGHIPEDQALLVVAIAKAQNLLFAGTEDFLVTREFREISTDDQRRHLLDCLFAVSAADHAISAEEEAQIRQISNELGFEHRQFIQARLAYASKRTVLRRGSAS